MQCFSVAGGLVLGVLARRSKWKLVCAETSCESPASLSVVNRDSEEWAFGMRPRGVACALQPFLDVESRHKALSGRCCESTLEAAFRREEGKDTVWRFQMDSAVFYPKVIYG